MNFFTHPTYSYATLQKYRWTYSDPESFKYYYLYQRHDEPDDVWNDRKQLAHNPAFAREAVDEFARALIQRSSEIKRIGGHKLFRRQTEGFEGGIDRQGNSMNAFLARYIVGELMAMGSVGIYVDNDAFAPLNLLNETKPYIYAYTAENILNWQYTNGELSAVLLRDTDYATDDNGLPKISEMYNRLIRKLPNGHIMVTIYNTKNEVVRSQEITLNKLPFVRISIPYSLMRDTADYQITMLNLRSAATYQAWASNFPLYTEQYNPHTDLARGATEEETKIQMGTVTGVRYPVGTDRPQWIHPSTDPIDTLNKFTEQLKQEIRQLTALAVTNLSPKMASAESKQKDREGLESGLSVIGMALQSAENQVAEIWHAYKNSTPAEIQYPKKYELIGEEERRANAKELNELQSAVPSKTYQKETAKVIVATLHGHRISQEKLEEINKEIDAAKVPTANPDTLKQDHEAGFVSDKTASVGRGYDENEFEEARIDHAKRIARIQAAQSDMGNRGIKDLDTNQGQSTVGEKELTQDAALSEEGSKKVRKEGD